MTVHKSTAAQADLEKIWLDSATDYGIANAQRVLRRFDELFQLLDDFPGVGLDYPGIRIVRIFPDKIRVTDHFKP